jgi:hypothetical protein
MRSRRHHGLQRRRTLGLEQLSNPPARLEHEVAPVGIGHAQDRLVAPQARDLVGKPAQPGERDVQEQRVALAPPVAHALLHQTGQPAAHALQRQWPARAAPEQCVDRDALHPRFAHDPAAIGALEHSEGSHQPDDRARRGAAHRIDSHVQLVLVA